MYLRQSGTQELSCLVFMSQSHEIVTRNIRIHAHMRHSVTQIQDSGVPKSYNGMTRELANNLDRKSTAVGVISRTAGYHVYLQDNHVYLRQTPNRSFVFVPHEHRSRGREPRVSSNWPLIAPRMMTANSSWVINKLRIRLRCPYHSAHS